MTGIINIVTTGTDRNTIEYTGKRLVEMRLAACAQIVGPIKSIYRWKGRMEEAITKLHPYELPEIIATRIEDALPEYAQWVMDETEPAAQA